MASEGTSELQTITELQEDSRTSSDVNSTPKRPAQRDIALAIRIALAQFVEKIIYYGVVTNLVIYCTNYLDYSSADAAVFSLVFTGVSYGVTMFGGWASDACFGNYNAIYVGLLTCLIGTSLLPLITFEWEDYYGPSYGLSLGTKRAFFIVALVIVNIGTAPIKACAAPFSAIQVEEYGHKVIQSTYHWVYLVSELAPLFCYSLLSYVQQYISFFLGFIIVLCFNFFILFIFCPSRDLYKNRPSKGNQALVAVFQMLKTAVTMQINNNNNLFPGCCCLTSCCSCSEYPDKDRTPNERSRLVTESPEHAIEMTPASDAGASSSGVDASNVCAKALDEISSEDVDCLDQLKDVNGGPYVARTVDEVKWLLNTLLVLSVAIFYNIVRFQYSTTYLLQGEVLDLDGIPVAFLAVFVPLFVVITVPVVEYCVYPLLEHMGVRVTLIKRMACGLVAAFLSVVSAALVEISRKQIIEQGGVFQQDISGVITDSSTLSVFVQIPQYVFIGVGDVLLLITALEFSFSQSPKYLQATITGIYLFYNGVGSLLGSLLVVVVNAASEATSGNEWIPDDINKGHLEYYFLVLAGVIVLDMAYLFVITKNYKYVTQYHSSS